MYVYINYKKLFLGKEWTKAKKIMSAGLSYRILKNSIPIFEEQAEILSQRLKSQAGKQCFQLIYPLQECIFDIIAGTYRKLSNLFFILV